MRMKRLKKEFKVVRKFLWFPKTLYPAIDFGKGDFRSAKYYTSDNPETRWFESASIVYEREPGCLNFWSVVGWHVLKWK